jgi:hypothetical protein
MSIAIFQTNEIAKAIAAGEPLFLGVPDKWFEPHPLFGCDGGHVSRRYLKAEGRHKAGDGKYYTGNLCFVCYRPIALIPHGYTDDTLQAALSNL